MRAGVWVLAAGLLCRVALGAPPTPQALEAEQAVEQQFERVGRSAPERDEALTGAAQALAQEAAAGRVAQAGEALHISHAVSAAGGFDPSPRALILRASPPEEALRTLAGRQDLSAEPASHLGVGFATSHEAGALVVLLAERKAHLRPFPRHSPRPGGPTTSLCGSLLAPLAHPELDVTAPSGAVTRLRAGAGGDFCFPVGFPLPGRYTLEVLGSGPRGPEVAALFYTDVGTVPEGPEGTGEAEPATAQEARARLLVRINRLRAAGGAGPLAPDRALDAVAQGYADKMARDHFFAHVAPDGTSLTDRLRAAGYAYETAGENLGLASGPLAAHFAIEHSPGHRKNLLDPAFRALGVGVAVEHLSGRDQTLVVEVLAAPIAASENPLADAYRALDARRAALHLPRLSRNVLLESLATEQARHALAVGEPNAPLPGTPMHERVFTLLPQVRRTSMDVYVTQDLVHLPGSRNLDAEDNTLVGVGAVRGDSRRYGKNRYWVVVIYAARR